MAQQKWTHQNMRDFYRESMRNTTTDNWVFEDDDFLEQLYGRGHKKTYTKDKIRFIEHWKPLAKSLDFSIDPTANLLSKNHLWKHTLANTPCRIWRDSNGIGIIVSQGGVEEFVYYSDIIKHNIEVTNVETLYKQLVDNALICYPTYEF